MIHNIAIVVRWIGIAVLGVTILVAPWCLGSIHASVQVWLFPAVMFSLVCALLTLLLDGKTRWSFPILLIPILLMLLMIGLQLRPHDQATLTKRSPKVAELRGLLLPAPDSAEYRFTQEICPETQTSADPAPTSIYPAATRQQLSVFVFVISAFFAALVLFRDKIAVYLFGASVVANGCVLALMGITMRLNTYYKSFWVWDNNSTTFSTFLNRNNAAGYLGMCLGMATLLMLWYFFRSEQEIEDSRRWDKRFERAYMTSKQIIAYQLSRMITAGVLIWGFFAGILITGILVSMSRGGSLSMTVALVIGFLVVFATRRFKLSMLGFALIGALGVGLIFWAGLDERVQARLETILTGDNSARPRNWSNAIDTARDFQWRGSGFGTYQYANLLNDEFAKDNRIFVRAENQYIEVFLDLGVWGLFLLLMCPVIAITYCWRLIWQQNIVGRSTGDDWQAALGCGLLIVIITQVVASLFDFGLYIPANALMLAVCCGILSRASASRKIENGDEIKKTTWRNLVSRTGLITVGCFFLVLTHWGNKEIRNIHRINLAMERLIQIRDFRSVSPDEFKNAIAELDAAIQYCPDDAISIQLLAESQIGLFRQTLYRDLLQVPGLQQSEDDIWNSTRLISIHASLGQWQRLGIQAPIRAVQDHPAVDPYLRPAYANLVRSRQANPMSVGTHLLIAELLPILDKDGSRLEFEQTTIKRITTVSPLSAAAWYETGFLEHNLGRSANARAYWKQSLSLSRFYLRPIIGLTKQDMRGSNATTLFRETFPNDPDLFLVLVSGHFTQSKTPDFSQAALEAMKDSCETATDITEGERHYYRGRYELLIGQYDSAIRELKYASQTQRSNHEWHYRLAQAYHFNQQFKEAEEEIKWALFYDPQNNTYKKLRDNIQKAIISP